MESFLPSEIARLVYGKFLSFNANSWKFIVVSGSEAILEIPKFGPYYFNL
jgi:hypothetical protein